MGHPADHMSDSALLSEVDSLKPLDDSQNNLRKLFERWNNRLTLQGASIAEQYIGGRCSLVVDVDFLPLSQSCVPANWATATAGLYPHGPHDDHLARIVFNVDTLQRCNVKHGNQQNMFVENIEVMEGTDRFITSFVRLYDVEYLPAERFWEAGLYYSTIKSRYELLPTLIGPKGELGVVGASSRSVHDLANHQVERALLRL